MNRRLRRSSLRWTRPMLDTSHSVYYHLNIYTVYTVLNCILFFLPDRLVCTVHGKAVGLQVSLSQIGAYTTAKEQRGEGGRDKQLNERITMHFGGCINELIGWF